MAQYQPGDVVDFYVDPLTETELYGTGTLKEKVSAKNFEGLETWIVEFYFDEESSGIETRQILSPEEDEIEQAANAATNPAPVPTPVNIDFSTIQNKPTTVEGYGITNSLFLGKARPITNSPVTPGVAGELVLYASHYYFCIGNNLWVEFVTIAVS